MTLKLATTLDGQAAAADGTSMWITSTEARRDVHLMRSRSDAVMVGAGTVLSDDPRLDVRLDGYVGRHPRPVVIAGSRPIPAGAAVLERDPVVLAPGPDAAPRGSVALPGPGGVDLPAGLEYLGRMGVVDLLVEGGPALAGSLLRGGLVDRLVFYLAGRLGGGAGIPVFSGGFGTLDDAVGLSILDVRRIGPDLKVVAVPNEHPGSGSVGDREDPA